jgi:hypothetical protein
LKAHGDGWRLFPGSKLKHGQVSLNGVGKISIRGQAKIMGVPKTAEILHKNGSQNRKKRIKCLAQTYRQLHQQRKNFLHQKSTEIIKKSQLIATEKLDISAMTRRGHSPFKKGLNREIA